MTIQSNIKGLKDLKKTYDEIYSSDEIKETEAFYKWIAGKFGLNGSNKKFLDIGCGTGAQLMVMEVAGGLDTFGVDISGKGIEIARMNVNGSRLAIANAEEMPFKDGSFNYIANLGSLEHFIHPDKAVREISRLVTADGQAIIMVPNVFYYKDIWAAYKTGNRLYRNQRHEIFATLKEWKNLFEENGLSITKTVKYNGISKSFVKQWFKDLLIPLTLSYHFVFICRKR